MEIKKVDKSVDTYYNSGIFENSLKYILKADNSPFEFFQTLGENMGDDKLSLKDKFRILFDTYNNRERKREFSELLKLDYVLKQRGALPEFFSNLKTKEHLAAFSDFINNEENIKKYFPSFCNKKPKDIIKYIDFEVFLFDGKETVGYFNRESGEHIMIYKR